MPALNVQVRLARPDDSSGILRLRAQGAREAFAVIGESPELLQRFVDERTDPSKLAVELADDNCYVFVATASGEIVGTAMLEVHNRLGELSACVSQGPGRGIGSALMSARLGLARELRLTRVWLETDTVNPAGIRHAERHGFEPVARRPGRRIRGNEVVRYERRP